MKRSLIVVLFLIVSVLSVAAGAAITVLVDDVPVQTVSAPSADASPEQSDESPQDLQILSEKLDTLTASIKQLETRISAPQTAKKSQNEFDVNQLSSAVSDLQTKLTQMEERDIAKDGQYQSDKDALLQELAGILDKVEQFEGVEGSTNVSNYYESLYYYYYDTPKPEPEDKEEDVTEDDIKEEEPLEHVHSFDQYGNCSDESCMEHQEAEVFDLIDLRRAKADSDYYYHIDWDGEINFEITFAYISSDDIEITLYSDADYMNEVPMDRTDAVYTAVLPEAATYYIQVHTLTDGDAEISIY